MTKVLKIDVPKVWAGLSRRYRHAEIRADTGHNGIGVLWRS